MIYCVCYNGLYMCMHVNSLDTYLSLLVSKARHIHKEHQKRNTWSTVSGRKVALSRRAIYSCWSTRCSVTSLWWRARAENQCALTGSCWRAGIQFSSPCFWRSQTGTLQ